MPTSQKKKNQASNIVRGSYKRSRGAKILPQYDLKLFDLLLEYRMMDANQIMTWLERDTPGKQKDCRDRLKLLFDHPNAYVDRIDIGQEFIEGGGSQPIVYALNTKGRKTLVTLSEDPEKYTNISDRVNNKTFSPGFIKHELFNTEVTTHIWQGCRKRGSWVFISRSKIWNEMQTPALINHPKRNANNRYGWFVPELVTERDIHGNEVTLGKELPIIPDNLVCILDKETEKFFYLIIEVDRNTEPVRRTDKTLKISDIWRKIYLYNRSAELQLYEKYLGIRQPFYILFVALNDSRRKSMIAANKEPDIRRGQGWRNFIFTTRDDLNKYGFLDAPMCDGRDDRSIYFRHYPFKT